MGQAYVLAVLAVSPVLAGIAYHGYRTGRRGAPPFWLVALLVLLALPLSWSLTAVAASWVLGFAWGARPRALRERVGRRERRVLCRAIDRKEMRFYYQPILDVLNVEPPALVAAECLVRWHKPDGVVQYPGPWLDVIQADQELSDAFHEMMWEDVASFSLLFPHIRVSVNTMPARVAKEGWGQMVVDRFDRLEVNAHQITVEVVEGTLLQDTPIVRENLECLRAAGCKIALDDFGEGQANLVTFAVYGHLVDVVKVDQKLIRHPDHRVAECIIRLAQSYGKSVVAEGVEEEETARWLRSLGVAQVQGWLYAKAMPLREFTHFAMSQTVS